MEFLRQLYEDIVWAICPPWRPCLDPGQLYQNVEDLVYSGGDVLLVLFAVAALLWWFIMERIWYFYGKRRDLMEGHSQRDLLEWHTQEALWIRQQWASEVRMHANRSFLAIKGLVQVCPLLGLLGTILGMVEVFEVLAITGSNSARALSSGIAHATLPTMAGLVIALSGYYFMTLFEHRAQYEQQYLRDHLLEGAFARDERARPDEDEAQK